MEKKKNIPIIKVILLGKSGVPKISLINIATGFPFKINEPMTYSNNY